MTDNFRIEKGKITTFCRVIIEIILNNFKRIYFFLPQITCTFFIKPLYFINAQIFRTWFLSPTQILSYFFLLMIKYNLNNIFWYDVGVSTRSWVLDGWNPYIPRDIYVRMYIYVYIISSNVLSPCLTRLNHPNMEGGFNLQRQRSSGRFLELTSRASGFKTSRPGGWYPGFNVRPSAINTPSGELVGCYDTEHYRY